MDEVEEKQDECFIRNKEDCMLVESIDLVLSNVDDGGFSN